MFSLIYFDPPVSSISDPFPSSLLLSNHARRLAGEQYAPDGYNIGVNNESGGRTERDASPRACDSTVCRGYGGAERRGERSDPGEEGVLEKVDHFLRIGKNHHKPYEVSGVKEN